MSTHVVTNQAPPRVDIDEFATNVPLVEAVNRYDGGWAVAQLHRVGQHVGAAEFQQDAELANTVEPVLHAFDRYGNRIDEVEYHPAYHRIIKAAIGYGAHTSAWAESGAGANAARAATFMLFAQVEPGHACPVSMTHSAVPLLASSPGLAEQWMPRLLSRSYDGTFTMGKRSALVGMAMTEKQGGSDVRANTTTAVDLGDGIWQLTGHKWFVSAPMSDAFFLLAQAPAGLSCFFVPRLLDDGMRNTFMIQRLKEKLGNRANASSEVEFDKTVGFLIGDEGRGVSTIMEMVSLTRLDNVYGSAAGMRQSVAEALWHVRHRAAFGTLLIDQPVMKAVVADLALESEAATATAIRLARAYDDDASEQERAFRRLATAVSKYWICKRGPEHAYESLECLGGNGYVEESPLARRYREQPVMAIWEGSGNVIALDVLRAILREPESAAAFDAEVSLAAGENPLLDGHLKSMRRLLDEVRGADAAIAAPHLRRLIEMLALALQASLLLRTAPNSVSDAFCGARLGEGRGHLYGVLPVGTDLAAILERH